MGSPNSVRNTWEGKGVARSATTSHSPLATIASINSPACLLSSGSRSAIFFGLKKRIKHSAEPSVIRRIDRDRYQRDGTSQTVESSCRREDLRTFGRELHRLSAGQHDLLAGTHRLARLPQFAPCARAVLREGQVVDVEGSGYAELGHRDGDPLYPRRPA